MAREPTRATLGRLQLIRRACARTGVVATRQAIAACTEVAVRPESVDRRHCPCIGALR